jgi:hypothetical protein
MLPLNLIFTARKKAKVFFFFFETVQRQKKSFEEILIGLLSRDCCNAEKYSPTPKVKKKHNQHQKHSKLTFRFLEKQLFIQSIIFRQSSLIKVKTQREIVRLEPTQLFPLIRDYISCLR